jgi:hypothetical protein
VWHFKLSSDEGERLHPEALTEMLRRQLKTLLSCVVLTSDGTDLRVTGFRLLEDLDCEHAIYAGSAQVPAVELDTPPSSGEAEDRGS